MLTQLYELAQSKGLLNDIAFESRKVHFILRIDRAGNCVELVSNLTEKGHPRDMRAPSLPEGRTSGIKAAFLVENAQYVLQVPKLEQPTAKKGADAPSPQERAEASKRLQRAEERAKKCHKEFAMMVRFAASDTGDEGLRAVANFFDTLNADKDRILSLAPVTQKKPARGGVKKPKRAKTEKKASEEPAPLPPAEPWAWSGDEIIAFALVDDEGRCVHDREAVAEWWRANAVNAEDQVGVGRCLVTGAVGPLTKLHPMLKGVPKTLTTGAALVSFNEASFRSWGRKQGENAPVSQMGAEGYTRAINWMLERDGKRQFRQGIQIADDTVLVFWSGGAAGTRDVVEDVRDLLSDPGEEFRRTVESVWGGLEITPDDFETSFYAATFAGNAARVAVRDWFETTAADVKGNIMAWMELLRIESPKEVSARPLALRDLLRAMETRSGSDGDSGGLHPSLAAKLVRCALRGDAVPYEVLTASLSRFRLALKDDRGSWLQQRIRAGLIRAALARPAWSTRNWEVKVPLDEQNDDIAYVLGRMFCELESLQIRALGKDLNSTVRDKFFTSASATPGLVFGTLIQRAQHHVSKIDIPGADKTLSALIHMLPGAPLPKVLTTEQQGLFVVGYYQQREANFRKWQEYKEQAEAKAAEKAAAKGDEEKTENNGKKGKK